MKELERIQRVETPPFLFTRIEEKVNQLKATKLSPALAWGMSLACCALLVLNVYVISNVSEGTSTVTSTIEEVYNLDSSNQLYNE